MDKISNIRYDKSTTKQQKPRQPKALNTLSNIPLSGKAHSI